MPGSFPIAEGMIQLVRIFGSSMCLAAPHSPHTCLLMLGGVGLSVYMLEAPEGASPVLPPPAPEDREETQQMCVCTHMCILFGALLFCFHEEYFLKMTLDICTSMSMDL